MAISSPTYCTREEVQRALDSKETNRNAVQIDRHLEASARSVEGLCHRYFYPWSGTKYFDWPNHQLARSWRLWLGVNEIVSASAVVSGGVTIPSSDYFLRRSDGLDEPPYTHIEIDLASSAAFSGGSTHQRSLAITGVWYREDSATAGTITEDLTSGETDVDVSDSTLVGVGTILKVGSERMLVTNRTMADTAVDTANAMTANAADVSITMSTTTAAPGEGDIIQIDSERMLVVSVASTLLTVKRAWDGTVLATHANPSNIFALRTLTVVRGFLGTTAAAHLTSAALTKHVAPPLVRELSIAECENFLLQESSGYSREIGSGEGSRELTNRGLADLREQVRTTFGRKARIAAV